MTNIEMLSYVHQDKYDSYEPYQGVAVLFNGDASKAMKGRQDWVVISPYRIVLCDEVEVETNEIVEDQKKEAGD